MKQVSVRSPVTLRCCDGGTEQRLAFIPRHPRFPSYYGHKGHRGSWGQTLRVKTGK